MLTAPIPRHPCCWHPPERPTGRFGALLALLLLVPTTVCGAHDQEQWISDNRLVDPLSQAWCCGPSDCAPLETGQVHEAHGGWLIKTPLDREPEFVPYSRALPVSPDGRYHRCVVYDNGKATSRCFIVPPGAS